MPGPHRRFLEHMITVANIRDFVESNLQDVALSSAYDQCLSALSSFRDRHLQIVSRYIVIMAQESKRKAAAAAAVAELKTPSPPVVKEEKKERALGLARAEPGPSGLTGTGGTKLMPFLKQSRDETMEPATGAWKKTRRSASLERLVTRKDVTPSSRAGHAASQPNSPLRGFAARSCKVNDFEDIPVPRVTGVGMAGDWEVGDEVGGICHY